MQKGMHAGWQTGLQARGKLVGWQADIQKGFVQAGRQAYRLAASSTQMNRQTGRLTIIMSNISFVLFFY
jgi:hypothetical protein